MKQIVLGLGCLVAIGAAGCDSSEWHPAAPSGLTYEYAAQGFTGKSVTAFGVAGGGVVGGGAFAFREKQGVVRGRGADPFAESAPINGVQFNEHLVGRGTRLAPDAAAPAAAPAPAAAGKPGTPPAVIKPAGAQ